ncbi:hypothetical protein FE257_011488 [Aspergillus nanangensis]|uniref:Uncharacterized protein n=1 Tax=Aspergillus nanangensis TaxID=2582783 RepID=A0AAD4CHA7_ASPNN|nr:hypothetical protein FE257_011488 [Aspergillus nanangensis]
MAPTAIDDPIMTLDGLTMSPPKVVGPSTKTATRPTNKIPQWLIDGARIPKHEKECFNANTHLNFQPPNKIYTMKEIGLAGHGISPNAVSEPFPLFSEEAIRQMRAEIFSEDVMENCQYESTFIKNMVRGMGTSRAPFCYDAWNSPEVLAKISQVAGVELVPAIDFDIANVNISAGDGAATVDLTAHKEKSLEDELSAVAWHFDSYPFVCVTMISDCTGMMGGETALRTASGEVMKVRGPAMALGGRERISMVTSFRPKSPFLKDETVLTGIRGISILSDVYYQYTQYRLENLEERIRARLKAERRREIAKRPFNIAEVRGFLTEQKKYLEAMLEEIY